MQVLDLGRLPYAGIEDRMRAFTLARGPHTDDELWIVEHDPVFTQGIAGRSVHVHDAGQIPLVQTARGGQVTYHGPGQVVAYPLVDLRRLGIYVREYVFRLERAVLQVLESFDVTGHRVAGAPGVYVRIEDPFGHAQMPHMAPGSDPFAGLGKIASLGIKVSNHCTYHGVALNVAMDLSPFERIDPCGHSGLRAIDLRSLGVAAHQALVASRLAQRLQVRRRSAHRGQRARYTRVSPSHARAPAQALP
jgi:lipoyl(octanoyl) transferase